MTRSHPARRYNYLLGGKDHFAADRLSAEQIADVFPGIRAAVAENRSFVRRAVWSLAAEHGVTQFLDVGVGLPMAPNVHEVAEEVCASARVVYVDNDAIVMAHARALLTARPPGLTGQVLADLREPETILSAPRVREVLDFSRPVGVIIAAVLHFVADEYDPYGCVAALVGAMPAGSFLMISHATLELLPPETAARLSRLDTSPAGHGPFRPRTRAQVARFFSGLRLLAPGLVPVVDWRPDLAPVPRGTAVGCAAYAAVGCTS